MKMLRPFGTRSTFHALAALLVSSSVAGAAQYWVATNGLDTNPGTQARPWLTVGHAASLAQTNDLVSVEPGSYAEYATPANSGSQGTNITYIGIGQPIIYGFNMARLCNWRIIGFHFTMTGAASGSPKRCININLCTNFQILDNYFENTDGANPIATMASAPAGCYCGLIRSNSFYRAGLVSNTVGAPLDDIVVVATNLLIEYNIGSQGGHFCDPNGGVSNIVRNNFWGNIVYTGFWNIQDHCDFIHYDPVPYCSISAWTVIEANYALSNLCDINDNNGHFYLMRNSAAASNFTMTDFIVRRNVAAWMGGMAGCTSDTPNIRDYNNTYAVIGGPAVGSAYNNYATSIDMSGGVVIPTNVVAINGIYAWCGSPTNGYALYGFTNGGSWATKANHNLSHQSGLKIAGDSGPSLTNVNPQFVNAAGFDYHLTNTSPGIAHAGPQTTTTSSGSSTTVVPVVDAGFFTDGWGIQWVNGDVVDVGTNGGVMISSIDYGANTLTLASPITFNSGDGVFLDGTQDIGAYKYDPAGYSYGISLIAPLNLASTPGTTTLTAAVTNPSKVRVVRFYVDGIEVANAPPAPLVSVSAAISGTNNVVQARAYALYADINLVATDSVTVNPSSVAPPSNLRYAQ